MGHASGQPGHSLKNPVVQPDGPGPGTVSGDALAYAEESERCAGGISHHGGPDVHRNRAAVAASATPFSDEVLPGHDPLQVAGESDGIFFGIEDSRAPAQHLGGRIAEDSARPRIPEVDPAIQVGEDDALVDGLK